MLDSIKFLVCRAGKYDGSKSGMQLCISVSFCAKLHSGKFIK